MGNQDEVEAALRGLTTLADEVATEDIEAALRRIRKAAEGLDGIQRRLRQKELCAELKRRKFPDPSNLAKEVLGRTEGSGGVSADGDERHGQTLALSDPEPADEPVDGAALLDEIVAAYGRFLVLPDGALEMLAVWTLHTYVWERFDLTPYVCVSSPTRECGKTTVLEVIAALSRRPVQVSDFTGPVLFRLIEEAKPSLFVDEASFVSKRDDLLPLLNAGFRQGGKAFRNVPVGDGFEVRGFAVFCPKAFARIGTMPDTLLSRSIEVKMHRAKPPEHWRIRREREFEPLRRRCARWAQDHSEGLAECSPDMPPSITGRHPDLCEPLFSIADLCGEHWSERARSAALVLSGRADEDADRDRNVQLLADIRAIFEDSGEDCLAASGLLNRLLDSDEGPYVEWSRDREMSVRGLSTALKSFGIKTQKGRWEGMTPGTRAYVREDFSDAFASYLPPDEDTVSATRSDGPAVHDSERATRYVSVADRERRKSGDNADVAHVADGITGTGEDTPGGEDEDRGEDVEEWIL